MQSLQIFTINRVYTGQHKPELIHLHLPYAFALNDQVSQLAEDCDRSGTLLSEGPTPDFHVMQLLTEGL
ncbi:MAG: hypothetical protein HC879_13635 [Leptolyngbyaceae cyanobacterium SL_5_9]|nr:hypothetical protein [Leptolyngbyaceae cyanobacterium SL_5_9]NJO75419.1 hypothetical protein [Leptolyngbyaceae cyanobacterium RM1_406_9]